jgi:hypothetical protein
LVLGFISDNHGPGSDECLAQPHTNYQITYTTLGR